MIPGKTEGLIPIMPFPVCPHCGAVLTLDIMTYGRYKGPLTCYYCKGRFEVEFGNSFTTIDIGFGPREVQNYAGLGGELLSPPRPLGDPELMKDITISLVPKEVYEDFEDAVTGLATSPPRLVAVACRYTVQRALLLKDIPEREPQEMLNIARQKQVLSEMAYRQCSAAIFMGGKGGHPQSHWTEQVELNDAKQAVLATRRVLLELFNPAALGA